MDREEGGGRGKGGGRRDSRIQSGGEEEGKENRKDAGSKHQADEKEGEGSMEEIKTQKWGLQREKQVERS